MLHQPANLDWREAVPIRKRLRFAADAVIAGGGERASRTLYLLLEGTVRLSLMTTDGREQAMAYLPRGSLFGEQAALGGVALCSELVAIADEPVEIGVILASDVAAAVNERPGAFQELMRITGAKTSLFLQAAARSAFGSARDRLASVLAALRHRQDPVAITQERLARLCGTTRVTVAAQLRQLAEEGAISMKRNAIVIRDMERLGSQTVCTGNRVRE